MTNDIFAKLDGAFDAHDARVEEAKKRQLDRESLEKARIELFVKVRDEVVVPAMNEMGEYLKNKGHLYRVEVNHEKSTEEPFAAFFWAPAGHSLYPSANAQVPYLRIRANRYSDKAMFMRSTMLGHHGGVSGGDGDMATSDVTREAILERLGKLVQEVIRR